MNEITPVKRISIIFMISFIATAIVVFILWALFAYWTSSPVPVAYVIREVQPNPPHMQESCDTPYVTVLENAVTGKTEYKCGNLGKPNEVITFYE